MFNCKFTLSLFKYYLTLCTLKKVIILSRFFYTCDSSTFLIITSTRLTPQLAPPTAALAVGGSFAPNVTFNHSKLCGTLTSTIVLKSLEIQEPKKKRGQNRSRCVSQINISIFIILQCSEVEKMKNGKRKGEKNSYISTTLSSPQTLTPDGG
jgi:hypothetical protein